MLFYYIFIIHATLHTILVLKIPKHKRLQLILVSTSFALNSPLLNKIQPNELTLLSFKTIVSARSN